MRQGTRMKIGDLAKTTGLTPKTIRYYELHGLIEEPERAESGYRYFGPADVERLEFIKKAKRLGLSLHEIKDILALHRQGEVPCVHVLELMDQKLVQLDRLVQELQEFRDDLTRLRDESQIHLEQLPKEARICGIIEHGAQSRGGVALGWLERSTLGLTKR
jgi:DNA-binding transcriptional MerR regulator